jgi:aflatoxin B1 aldehyde reductase
VKHIDSAQLYAKVLGKSTAGSRFTNSTKWLGGFGGKLNTKTIVEREKESFELLKVKKSKHDELDPFLALANISAVDIFYVHAPDTSVPLKDWLPGVQEVYQSDVFSRFRLSNFRPRTLQEVSDYCKKNDCVVPTVYQGKYSPVARKQETILPLLRTLNIAFCTCSPTSGGFLTKMKQYFEQGTEHFSKDTLIRQVTCHVLSFCEVDEPIPISKNSAAP